MSHNNNSVEPSSQAASQLPHINTQAPTFTAQQVEEIVSATLSRQASSRAPVFQEIHKELKELKLRDTSNRNPNQSPNQAAPRQPLSSIACTQPKTVVNKRAQVLAQADKASERQQSLWTQSKPPATSTSKTPDWEDCGTHGGLGVRCDPMTTHTGTTRTKSPRVAWNRHVASLVPYRSQDAADVARPQGDQTVTVSVSELGI
ncbi:hypothetical protein PCANC_09621, partial [Puccinia coronata f. sp. avenae]